MRLRHALTLRPTGGHTCAASAGYFMQIAVRFRPVEAASGNPHASSGAIYGFGLSRYQESIHSVYDVLTRAGGQWPCSLPESVQYPDSRTYSQ
jgi:hypothetical protein